MRTARLGTLLLALAPTALAPRLAQGQTLALRAPDVAPPALAPPSPPAEPEGAEPERLAELRLAERDGAAIEPLSEVASRQGVSLPEVLQGPLSSQLLMPPLNIGLRPRVLRQLALYRTDPRARRAVQSWMRHAGRYRGLIESTLLSEGMPTDLLWVAAAESGFDPASTSGVGAAGLWQLMPEAARTYGLRVDAWVDERRDPQRSTRAAVRYLRDLHGRFGSWELALAAYNMGYNGLLRTMRRFNTNDFETLASLEAGLPYETVHYVPRILAAAVAARNAAALGVSVDHTDPPAAADDVPLTRSYSLTELATATGSTPEQLRALNPSLQGQRTPPTDTGEPFVLHVPQGSGARARAALEAAPRPVERWYRLQWGETVDELAARYGVDPSALLALSGFTSSRLLGGGVLLRVPDREPGPLNQAERPVVVVQTPAAPPTTPRFFYRVGPTDEVATVARALGVDRERLSAWNSLDERSRWQAGLWLQVYLSSEPAGVRLFRESEVLVLERGSESFYDRSVARDGRVRLHIAVGDADTMSSLAERFGLTQGSLARINRRPRNGTLTPGERLVVYVTRERLAELQRDAVHPSPGPQAAAPAPPAP